MSPHTAWLILQGIETLPLRMARPRGEHARWCSSSPPPDGGAVGYPELEATPATRWRKAAAARLRLGVQLRPEGQPRAGPAFIEALKIFSHLANVGDCRSLVIHPASTTHFRMDDARCARRHRAGHDPAVDRPGRGRRPDRRPEARAQGGREGGGVMELSSSTAARPTPTPAASPSTPRCPASSSSTARCTTTAPGTCWRAGSRTMAMPCWRSTSPATAAAKARRWRPSRRSPTGRWRCWTPPASCARRAGGPQHGLADRARDGGARAGAHHAWR